MSKRTTFTTISPLPPGIPRDIVLDFLHDHQEMIDLNPLIIERHAIPTPPHAPEEEVLCRWWSLTDQISYLPGVKGALTYTAAFQDLRDGLQTHCYAPMGTHIRERWSLGGTLPGEPQQPVELGIGAPSQGLYLREDVEVRCNFLMAGFVKKTILKAHGLLVERLAAKAEVAMVGRGLGRSMYDQLVVPSTLGVSGGSGVRSSSTHDERRVAYLPSGTNTPRASEQHHRQQHHSHGGGSIGGSSSLQPLYGNQRAAASDLALGPAPFSARHGGGEVGVWAERSDERTYAGQGWQNQAQVPYVHDPYNPFEQQWGSTMTNGYNYVGQKQSKEGSPPIPELRGSEVFVAELQ
ncbi:hypothetical protein BX600DRAFT_429149 [Xylariales sp. PMI_506]|nr:hypothetical protein BX600DRAFT_429149 [Xylariales sp. PMI_506]